MQSANELPSSTDPSDFIAGFIIQYLNTREGAGATLDEAVAAYEPAQIAAQEIGADWLQDVRDTAQRGLLEHAHKAAVGPLKSRLMTNPPVDVVRQLDAELAKVEADFAAQSAQLETRLAQERAQRRLAAAQEAARRTATVRQIALWLKLGREAGVPGLESRVGFLAQHFMSHNIPWPMDDHSIRRMLISGEAPAAPPYSPAPRPELARQLPPQPPSPPAATTQPLVGHGASGSSRRGTP